MPLVSSQITSQKAQHHSYWFWLHVSVYANHPWPSLSQRLLKCLGGRQVLGHCTFTVIPTGL